MQKGAALVIALLVISAGSRFILRRRAARGPAALFAVVDRNRSRFVRVTIVDRHERASIAFARWDDAANEFRTCANVRVTLEGEEHAIVAGVPVEFGPGMLGPDPSGRVLSAPMHATMWILARPAGARGDAGLRTGASSEPTLEPILNRFIVVRDANGPDAPAVRAPGFLEALLHPGVFSAALVLIAVRSTDATAAQGWLLGALMVLGFIELLLWSLVFARGGSGR